jgi:serine/threonine-protein phosphatase 2A regulatory subunit A
MLRMVAVRVAAEVGAVASQGSLVAHLLPLLCTLASDKVANVRFNTAKALQKLAPIVAAATAESTVVPLLETMAQDRDGDVKHFAEAALQSYNQAVPSGSKSSEEHK